MKFDIVLRRHNFWIYIDTRQTKKLVYGYLSAVTSKKSVYNTYSRSMETVNDKTYAARSPCGRLIGLLIADLPKFIEHLEFAAGITKEDIKFTQDYNGNYERVRIDFKEGFPPKPDQVPAVEFLAIERDNYILDCATGFGKTYLGLDTIAKRGARTLCIMQAGHIKTWLEACKGFWNVESDDIVVLNGNQKIKTALELHKMGIFKAKVIFISTQTLSAYIKEYENNKEDFSYDVTPMEFCAYMGIGFTVVDETHEMLHALAKIIIYLNVVAIMFLSATLVSDDKFILDYYKKMFKMEDRWRSPRNNHIVAHSVRFHMAADLQLKSSSGYGYSHIRYEKSIMQKKRVLNNYTALISRFSDIFEEEYEPGKKMLIFCASTALCEYLARKLQERHPDFSVSFYTAKSPKSDLYEKDIVVTTPKSAGTGVDIKNLSHAFNTVSIGSTKQAFQILGRLRPIKDYPDTDPKFYFLTNMSIPAQAKFERKRRVDYVPITKSIKPMNLDFTLSGH